MQAESDKDVILEAYYWIYQCALYAMNADITDVDVNHFKSKKALDKLCSTSGFSENYLPNKRFHLALKEIKTVGECKIVSERLSAYLRDKIAEVPIEEREEKLKETKLFVLELFDGSDFVNGYRQRLDTIHCEEVSVKEAYTKQLPLIHNDEVFRKYSKHASLDEVKEYLEKEYVVLFVLGDVVTTLKQVLKCDVNVSQIKNYIDPNKELLFLYSVSPKVVLNAAITSEEMDDILIDAQVPVVVNYKDYDYEKDEIINHSGVKQDLFIYCDWTYRNFMPFYEYWKDRILHYRWLQYSQLSVLIVKINDNRFALLPVTSAVGFEAQADIDSRNNFIRYDRDEEYDDEVLTVGRKEKIDAIISYLIFLKNVFENENSR